MISRNWCARLAALALFAVGAAELTACSQASTSPSGVLNRPAGLAYAARTSPTMPDCTAANGSSCSITYTATLFIADSEAQGVRVMDLRESFTKTVSDTGAATWSVASPYSFVLAPVVFFPLVIPAGGFPTDVALSADGNRLYVLAPATKTLHVLDVHAPMTSPADSYRPIDEIALDGIGTSTATPVALAMVASVGPRDHLVIAYDGGATGSVLAGLTVDSDGTKATLVASTTAPINGAPRDLLVRGDVVIASSALPAACRATPDVCLTLPPSYELSLVREDHTNGTIALSPAQPLAPVEVGGPTAKLIDYGAQGFLALRLDRTSAVFVQAMNDAYTRYPDLIPSPFTPQEERGTPELAGRIDFRVSPAMTGGYASLQGAKTTITVTNGDTSTQEDISLFPDETNGPFDLAVLVHLDGQASFLSGSPPSVRFERDERITSVYDEGRGPNDVDQDVRLGPGNSGFCTSTTTPQLCGTNTVDPGCTADIVGTQAEQIDTQVLRASYRGMLVKSRTGKLVITGTSTSGLALELRDALEGGYEARMVRPGDSVLVQIGLLPSCASPEGDPNPTLALATFTASVAAVLPQTANTAPGLRLTPVATTALAGCAIDPVGVPAAALRYEVYPSTDEIVVSRADTTLLTSGAVTPSFGVSRVFERIAIAPDAKSAVVGDIVRDRRHDPALNIQMVAPNGFSCTVEDVMGVECTTDAQCGGAAGSCVGGNLGSCAGRCSAAKCNGWSCNAVEKFRRCSGLRFGVSGRRSLTADLSSSSSYPATAPVDVAFSPIRRSFFITFPGTREIAELYSEPLDPAHPESSRTLNVRHIR